MNIIELAKEAGLAEWYENIQQYGFRFASPENLERFAALVAAQLTSESANIRAAVEAEWIETNKALAKEIIVKNEALKLAEEAMTDNMRLLGAKALAAIREALAQPYSETNENCSDLNMKQEPVALYIRKDQLQRAMKYPCLCEVSPEPRSDRVEIYAAPVQPVKQQKMICTKCGNYEARYANLPGLTEKDICICSDWKQAEPDDLDWITPEAVFEAKLAAHGISNPTAEPVKHEVHQEPVIWHHPDCEGECIACLIERCVKDSYGTQGLDFMLRHINAAPVDVKAIRKAARAEALEQAANVCDELRHPNGWSEEKIDSWLHGAISCAAAIRRMK